MFNIRYAQNSDLVFWFTQDKHISEHELKLKIRNKRAFIICDGEEPIGVLRYQLLWDMLPFLTMLHLCESCRGKGFGSQAMLFWEQEMSRAGHKMTMTSTQVNEDAQHFYRKLGYIERGSLFLDHTPFDQPQEMFLIKMI